MEIIVTPKSSLEATIASSTQQALATELEKRPLVSHSRFAKEWLTNEEAVDYLGLSRPTLQRYRASGKLPYSKVGGSVYYRLADVEALLERHYNG